jgi:hypothetical protein
MMRHPAGARRAGVLLVAAWLLVAAPVTGSSQAPPATRLLIVTGVSGEKQYADQLIAWGSALKKAAVTRYAMPESAVVWLAEDPARAPGRIRGKSTAENVLAAIADFSRGARAGDRAVILLFGHGSSQAGESRFNLPGPDLSAEQFAAAIAPLKGQTVAFVNTASASGDFVPVLAGPNRIVLTATRSGREQNETHFPGFFVQALTSAGGEADADKDGRVSLLEAYVYARHEVERMFEQGNRLATEHPLLDDDGDGKGHTDASDAGPDGTRARSFYLEPLGGGALAADPRAASLVAARQVLEARIDSLRGRRSAMTEEAYQAALEPLLLDLAEKTRALRALEPRKP